MIGLVPALESLGWYLPQLFIAPLVEGLARVKSVLLTVSLANVGLIISDLALVLEFAPSSRHPTYMGIARGLLGPWIGLAPILGVVLSAWFGHSALLAVG